MIASSPMDLQSVLDGIAERAARLCDAEDAAIFRLDGNFLRLVAHFGPIPIAGNVGESGRVLDRGTPAGRAIIDRQTIHIHDLRAADAEFPEAKARGIAMGLRTVLDTPLLRENVAIGAIHIRRREVRPFLRAANQAPRNLCRPSCDRDRECAAIPRTQGIARAADGDE